MGNIDERGPFRIEAKYAPKVLMPANAIERSFFGGASSQKEYDFVTSDGKICKAQFLSAWRNEEGRYDERLDLICMRNWKTPFASVKSLWISRLGTIDDCWYLIELKA